MLNVKNLRPLNFNQVVGNTKNIELINNALKYGFPNFSVFIGQEGIGKTTISKILSKHLVCEEPFNGLACNECSNCKSVNLNVIMNNKDTLNVVTFRMSDEGGKRAARKIEEFIRQVPIGGGKKVIILEECQGMSIEAQDLLLPILEYIPDDTKIIACTTNEKALQRTFLSRANIFRFVVPTKRETVSLLTDICRREGISIIGTTVIPRIVEYSGNKPRASVMTLQKLTSQGNEINLSLVNDFLNLINEEYYLEYLNLLRGDMGLILDFLDKLERDEISLVSFIKDLNNFIVKLVTLRYRQVYLPEGIVDKSKALVKSMTEEDLLKIQSIISEETPKILDEEFAKSQLISLSFKIMNRNKQDLLSSNIKTKVQVEREKESAIKAHARSVKEFDNNTQISNMDISSNPNALFEGMNDVRLIRPKTAPTENKE